MNSDDLDRRIDAALRASPPAAPSAMAARIMERVDRVELARERLAESLRARPRGWPAVLAAFASEPAAAVALALLPVCLVFWVAWPGTAAKLALLVHESLAAWIAGAAGGFAMRFSLGPQGASVLGSALVAALLAVSFFSLQWIAEPFRALRSTSSRKSPPAPR